MQSYRSLTATWLIALTGAMACGTTSPSTGRAVGVQVRVLDVEVNGLSSLTRDDRGALWSSAEREHVLVAIPTDPTGKPRVIAVAGAAEGLQFEALAWMTGQRFAIGTEGPCEDGTNAVLVVDVDGDRARVIDHIAVPMPPWQDMCEFNRGIEALCHVDGQLLVGFEIPREGEGPRVAHLASIDIKSKAITPMNVALTSEQGKLSTFDCRAERGAIRVRAIERHFETAHLIEFTVPAQPAPDAAIPARLVRDIRAMTDGFQRNLEGLARLDDRRVAIMVDNQRTDVVRANELLIVTME